MRYQSFTITNFKGIDELTLDLASPITTLIGLNESGKTTLLEAIFCFSYGKDELDDVNPDLTSIRNPEDWIPVSQRANFNDTINISAKIDLQQSDRDELGEDFQTEFSTRLDGLEQSVWS